MSIPAQAYGFIQTFLLLAAAAAWLLPPCRKPYSAMLALLIVCAILSVTPVRALPLYGYLLGLAGELSVTTLLLLGYAAASGLRGRSALGERNLAMILLAVLIAGIVLYPASTGLLPFDPYREGYAPVALLIALMAIAVYAWFTGRRAAAFFPIVAVAAFDFHLLESFNLWDYLIDPPVTIFAWGWLALRLARRRGDRTP